MLALISQGLTTTYALQSEAGLSLGASVPALKRLEDAALVNRKISGRRHEFSLTTAGKKILRDWRPPSGRPSSDYDDVLRTAYLCVFLRHEVGSAADLLEQAARARLRAAADRQDEIGGTRIDTKRMDAGAYRSMRLISEQHRLASESTALQILAKGIRGPGRRRAGALKGK